MLILSVLAILAFIAVAIWESAKARFLITFMARNRLAAVEVGGEPVELIANLPSGLYLQGSEIRGDLSGPGIMQSNKKLHWIGFPWRKIREFKLVHERMNPDIDDDTEAKDWMIKDPDLHDEWFLLVDVLHEFLLPGVELKSGYRVIMVVQLHLLLRYPLITFYNRMGTDSKGNNVAKFYDEIQKVLSTSMDNALQALEYDSTKKITAKEAKEKLGFLNELKNATSAWSEKIRDEINLTLAKLTGYTALELYIPKWDLASKAEQELARRQLEAEINKAAMETEAEGEVAELNKTIEAVNQMKGLTDAERSEMITRIMVSKNISKSNLTVYAEGGANLAVGAQTPQGGGKKKGGGRKP